MAKRSLVIRAALATALLLAFQVGNSVQQRDDNADMEGEEKGRCQTGPNYQGTR